MTVTGDPQQAFVDAVGAVLKADAALQGLVQGVFGHLSEAKRTAYPYLVLGRRHHTGDAGAMQKEGGHVSLQLDGWSDHKGPSEMHAIHSRVYVLLERQALAIAGFTLITGSVHREFAEVFDEPDVNNPTDRLYHGVQLWTCEIHES